MKRFIPFFYLLAGFILILVITGLPLQKAYALPEYSAQVGEPCSSCHISPSGGGPRGVRGQAWVGSEKPGSVPSLLESLDILGVNLDVDPEQFVAPSEAATPPQPLISEIQVSQDLFRLLFFYDGN